MLNNVFNSLFSVSNKTIKPACSNKQTFNNQILKQTILSVMAMCLSVSLWRRIAIVNVMIWTWRNKSLGISIVTIDLNDHRLTH